MILQALVGWPSSPYIGYQLLLRLGEAYSFFPPLFLLYGVQQFDL